MKVDTTPLPDLVLMWEKRREEKRRKEKSRAEKRGWGEALNPMFLPL